MPATLSIVIPTLDAAWELPRTADALLEGVTDGLVREVVISDGGSTDDTAAVAKELGAVWIEGPPGRGGQIARGVATAQSDWFLILHADTWLSDGWPGAVRAHMANHPDKAGWFSLRFRAAGLAPRIVAGGANWRSRALGLPYGDQGLLVSRRKLEDIGGIPDLALMEDVVLAKRLKGRLRRLEAEAQTSAERYVRDGWVRRPLRNLGVLARFWLGTDVEALQRRYQR